MISAAPEVVLSGIGITAAVGQGKAAFGTALMRGDHAFRVMRRPGRQQRETAFLGAELPELTWPTEISSVPCRTSSVAEAPRERAVAKYAVPR